LKNKVEKLAFTVDPNLLKQVILRQAGSMSKAILELIMNSVDAGAKSIQLTIKHGDGACITVVDDGKGFPSRKYIEEYFQRFGTEHKKGDSTFGEFRMGRGQAFAMGKNRWRSGKFELRIDVRDGEGALGFELETLPETVKGCEIELWPYSHFPEFIAMRLVEELKQQVRWLSIPVFVNGLQITESCGEAKWDVVTEQAYVKIEAGGSNLRLFNMGIFVNTLSNFGVSGVVVSKQRLRLNFARNDVITSGPEACPVWKIVEKQVRKLADQHRVKAKKLTRADIEDTLRRLKSKEIAIRDVEKLKIFPSTTGRHYSYQDIKKVARKYRGYAVAMPTLVADTTHKRELAFIFDADSIAKALQVYGEAHKKLDVAGTFLQEIFLADYMDFPSKSFASVSKTVKDSHDLVPPDNWTPKERVWIQVLARAATECREAVATALIDEGLECNRHHVRYRKVVLGDSITANGWTDGSKFIAVSRQFLSKKELSVSGVGDAVQLIIHEFCHQDASTEDGFHTPEFYERCHNVARIAAGSMTALACGHLRLAARTAGYTLPQRSIYQLNRCGDEGLDDAGDSGETAEEALEAAFGVR